jgi:hypothetical protein
MSRQTYLPHWCNIPCYLNHVHWTSIEEVMRSGMASVTGLIFDTNVKRPLFYDEFSSAAQFPKESNCTSEVIPFCTLLSTLYQLHFCKLSHALMSLFIMLCLFSGWKQHVLWHLLKCWDLVLLWRWIRNPDVRVFCMYVEATASLYRPVSWLTCTMTGLLYFAHPHVASTQLYSGTVVVYLYSIALLVLESWCCCFGWWVALCTYLSFTFACWSSFSVVVGLCFLLLLLVFVFCCCQSVFCSLLWLDLHCRSVCES